MKLLYDNSPKKVKGRLTAEPPLARQPVLRLAPVARPHEDQTLAFAPGVAETPETPETVASPQI